MLIVIIALGTTDLLFALDSIPAIYGLTKEPFLVLTANIFALMGLRQLYFLIGGLLKKLVYLSIGLAVLLAFIGVKLVLHALHENNLPFINGGQPLERRPRHPDLGVSGGHRPDPRGHDDREPVEVEPRRQDRGLTRVQGGLRAVSGVRDLRDIWGRPCSAGAEDDEAGRDDAGHSGQLRRRQHLRQHDEPGEGRDGRLEAEQDAEHVGSQVSQGDELEGVGQHRGQDRDPETEPDGVGRPGGIVPTPNGSTATVATTSARDSPSSPAKRLPVRC